MKCFFRTIFVLQVCILAVCPQCSYALDLPDEALRMIAETTTDTCPLCVEQKLKHAFAIMAARLQPGLVLETDDSCRLRKNNPKDDLELSLTCYQAGALRQSISDGQKLPDVVFAFYMPEKRLVGISETDYTDGGTIDEFRASPPGTVFEGKIRLIPYKYGDGPAFNYFPAANRVLIHCVILRLKPLAQ